MQRHGEDGFVKMEVEMGVLVPPARGARNRKNLKDTKKKKKDWPLASTEGACPASTLISGF